MTAICRNCGGPIEPIGRTGAYGHQLVLGIECDTPAPAPFDDPELRAFLEAEAMA